MVNLPAGKLPPELLRSLLAQAAGLVAVALDSSHMCGRFGLSDIEQMERRFGVELTEGLAFEPTYNAAPGQALPVIVPVSSGRTLALMRWGLVPSWARDEKIGYKLINARSETAAEKPSFRAALRPSATGCTGSLRPSRNHWSGSAHGSYPHQRSAGFAGPARDTPRRLGGVSDRRIWDESGISHSMCAIIASFQSGRPGRRHGSR